MMQKAISISEKIMGRFLSAISGANGADVTANRDAHRPGLEKIWLVDRHNFDITASNAGKNGEVGVPICVSRCVLQD